MILPDWPAPASVVAVSTQRVEAGGRSVGAYRNCNLGLHVGDDPAAVATNRLWLLGQCEGLRDIAWLNQVHGTAVAVVDEGSRLDVPPDADAALSRTPGMGCAVMTADCLPVLFCDRQGRQVAAAHAGWRGLCDGVLAATVAALAGPACEVMAWLGPAISARHFEVGGEVRAAFIDAMPASYRRDVDAAFAPHPRVAGKFYGDLYQLARLQLRHAGVQRIYGGDRCTYAEQADFFSFRRDPITGRQASLIYLKHC